MSAYIIKHFSSSPNDLLSQWKFERPRCCFSPTFDVFHFLITTNGHSNGNVLIRLQQKCSTSSIIYYQIQQLRFGWLNILRYKYKKNIYRLSPPLSTNKGKSFGLLESFATPKDSSLNSEAPLQRSYSRERIFLLGDSIEIIHYSTSHKISFFIRKSLWPVDKEVVSNFN